MDIQGKNLWQHAAGDSDHNHVDICLKWGVILNGPGGEGEWNGGTHYGYLGRRKQTGRILRLSQPDRTESHEFQ